MFIFRFYEGRAGCLTWIQIYMLFVENDRKYQKFRTILVTSTVCHKHVWNSDDLTIDWTISTVTVLDKYYLQIVHRVFSYVPWAWLGLHQELNWGKMGGWAAWAIYNCVGRQAKFLKIYFYTERVQLWKVSYIKDKSCWSCKHSWTNSQRVTHSFTVEILYLNMI